MARSNDARARFTPAARRLGVSSAVALVVLQVAYAVTLAVGFASLESPDQPIGDPMFWMLEVLILLMAPVLVSLMAAVHAWAAPARSILSLAALAFMALVAGLTACVHFVILAVGRHEAFAGQPWLPLLFSFRWPSVAYALDILAWDVFFALSMLFAAPVFGRGGLGSWVRRLMIASALLALAGLIGVAAGDMQVRNIGIVGYAGVFPVAAGLLALLFYRARPDTEGVGETLGQTSR